MVAFTPETKRSSAGSGCSHPGKGKLMEPRSTGGAGEKYGPGGPGGSGGGTSSAGPNGTTKGPAGETPVDFKGAPPSEGKRPWPEVRGASNPTKR